MSVFTGRQGKGAMRHHREDKRTAAEERNRAGRPQMWTCGHVSSSADHPCEVSR